MRAALRAKKSGDLETHRRSLEQWRAQMRAFSFRPLWLGMLSVLVIIPSITAFVLSEGVPALKKEHGRLRYATHRERIQSTLHAFERRGLLTPMNRD